MGNATNVSLSRSVSVADENTSTSQTSLGTKGETIQEFMKFVKMNYALILLTTFRSITKQRIAETWIKPMT